MKLFNPLLGRLLLVSVLALGGFGLAACNDDDSSSNNGNQQTSSQSSGTQAATPAAPEPGAEASVDDNDYVVFDGSGSMGSCVDRQGREYGPDGKCVPKITGGKTAVHAAIAPLPTTVHLGLYVFDSNGDYERLPLAAQNKDAFLAQVDKIDAGSGTPLGPAMDKGVDALVHQYKMQLGYGTYRLIVVTDGMPDSMSAVEHALKHIQQSGVPIQIYTIGFGMNDPNHPLRKASVTFTAAYNGEEVQSALQQAVSETSNFDPTDFQK